MMKGWPAMRILYCTSEIAPYAKTGGLADVASALPQALRRRGHDVRTVMPRYVHIGADERELKRIVRRIGGDFFSRPYWGEVWETVMADGATPVYFIAQPELFERKELYGEDGRDYADNHLRFAYLCLAALELLKRLNWRPDAIICNDWQTALIPVYLRNRAELRDDPFFQSIKTLFVIHNIGYQGLCPREAMREIRLPDDLFQPAGIEFYGRLNLLKGGMIYCDRIATVSEQHAREIQTEEYGFGLDGVLRERAELLSGIMNGIDGEEWNPADDELLPAHYNLKRLAGKAKCKRTLQQECGLAVDAELPLIGMVTRLATQKGLDLIEAAMARLERLRCQWVILGSGDKLYEDLLAGMARRRPRQCYVRFGFDEQLAHRIFAGSDAFLIPSRYEPCGLTQFYAMRYGAVPVARRTGGLADSIVQATEKAVAKGQGTGFLFNAHTPEAMLTAIRKALKVKTQEPILWRAIQRNGMAQDFTWTASAERYERLLQLLISRGA
ncbi:glycogen synthase GlgA [Candidatus Sumerlaeota bacterium]|nr:glycogen synthase GlgA [Candidatus Sumerlaeota bacterium]